MILLESLIVSGYSADCRCHSSHVCLALPSVREFFLQRSKTFNFCNCQMISQTSSSLPQDNQNEATLRKLRTINTRNIPSSRVYIPQNLCDIKCDSSPNLLHDSTEERAPLTRN